MLGDLALLVGDVAGGADVVGVEELLSVLGTGGRDGFGRHAAVADEDVLVAGGVAFAVVPVRV